jgi:hypothetical protein
MNCFVCGIPTTARGFAYAEPLTDDTRTAAERVRLLERAVREADFKLALCAECREALAQRAVGEVGHEHRP